MDSLLTYFKNTEESLMEVKLFLLLAPLATSWAHLRYLYMREKYKREGGKT